MNSSNLFLSELEDMRSSVYRAETANEGKRIVVIVASSFCTAAWENWVDRESLNNTICDMSLQLTTNSQSANYCVAYLNWQECHNQELEKSQREKNHGTDTWVVG